jgi:hypothetical protein
MDAPVSKPLLNVYVVWHPHFRPGTDPALEPGGETLATSLFEALASQPRRVMSPGLGIPVFFVTSDGTSERPEAPADIDLDRAEHTVVLVLVDHALRGDKKWVAYAKKVADAVLTRRDAGDKSHLVLPILFIKRESAPDLGRTQNIGIIDDFSEPDEVPRPGADVGSTAPSSPCHSSAAAVASKRVVGFRLRVASEIWRLLKGMEPGMNSTTAPPPLRLFVSHAKFDGEPDAIELLRKIADSKLDSFFDKQNIAAGYDFAKEILGYVGKSAVVALQSDAYASRPWCRQEILTAKRHGMPLLVVHLTRVGEDRSFPYLGNVPTLRWNGSNQLEILAAAARECLRVLYAEMRFERMKEAVEELKGARVLARAPELIDGVRFRRRASESPTEAAQATGAERAAEAAGIGPSEVPRKQLVLYPDPPLGTEETEALGEFFPELVFVTPTTLDGRPSLGGKAVALSISESPDLLPRRLSGLHLVTAMLEIARHVFARGGIVAYGGDLRPSSEGGLTQELFQLVGSYKGANVLPNAMVWNYLAWPLYLPLRHDPDRKAQLWRVAELQEVPPPDGLLERLDLDKNERPTGEHAPFAGARSFTRMRRVMTEGLPETAVLDAIPKVDARVVMGGRLTGYSGKYPGLLEEAVIALRAKQPLYLVGAFGGCAGAIIEAIQGGDPEAFTLDYQIAARPAGKENWGHEYAALVERYKTDTEDGPVDYAKVVSELKAKGIAGLNNGLTMAENQELFTTDSLDRVITLLMKGLKETLGTTPAA